MKIFHAIFFIIFCDNAYFKYKIILEANMFRIFLQWHCEATNVDKKNASSSNSKITIKLKLYFF